MYYFFLKKSDKRGFKTFGGFKSTILSIYIPPQ